MKPRLCQHPPPSTTVIPMSNRRILIILPQPPSEAEEEGETAVVAAALRTNRTSPFPSTAPDQLAHPLPFIATSSLGSQRGFQGFSNYENLMENQLFSSRECFLDSPRPRPATIHPPSKQVLLALSVHLEMLKGTRRSERTNQPAELV